MYLTSVERETLTGGNENKITIGFKGSPELKIRLCAAADKLGITQSALCFMLLHDFTDVESFQNRGASENEQIEKLQNEVYTLKERIEFYENSKLKKIFSELEGSYYDFEDNDGNQISLTIRNLKDTYTLLIHAFKYDA